MRRWFILLAASLLSTNLMMLAKDVKGTVIAQKDGQPVMGAEVIVKGTEISTVTDVDGRFILEDVPDDAKKIQIIYIGVNSIIGLTPISDVGLLDDYRNFSAEISVGYYF